MSDVWLSGYERIDVGPDGGTWKAPAVRWRGVLHTTEGSFDASLAAYRRNGTPPHVTVDPSKRRKAQHIPLDRAAYALRNLPGGVETNRVPCIQVEIVGSAAKTYSMSMGDLIWLGVEVLRPIMDRVPILPVGPPRKFVDGRDGFIARPDAPQRLSFNEWIAFGGWCGHQHVPENNHWDPGRLDLASILKAATRPNQQKEYRRMYVDGFVIPDGKMPNGRYATVNATADGRVAVLNNWPNNAAKWDKGDLLRNHKITLAPGAQVYAIEPIIEDGKYKGYILLAEDGGTFEFR